MSVEEGKDEEVVAASMETVSEDVHLVIGGCFSFWNDKLPGAGFEQAS